MGAPRLQIRSTPRRNRGQGYTLLELMFAVAVVGLLAAIAVPSYARILEQQKVQQGERDLRLLGLRIENYRTAHGVPPDYLSQLNMTLP
jgi:type IV pilus assembly protein PilE